MSNNNNPAFMLLVLFFELLIFGFIFGFLVICRWKIFVKAGQPGWYALIPIYSTYIMTTKVAGKDDTMFVLHLLPLISIYAAIMTNLGLAKSFGKDEGYGIGLTFLWIVFLPMLAFGNAQFVGPGGAPPVKDSSNSLTTDWQNSNNNSNHPNIPPQV